MMNCVINGNDMAAVTIGEASSDGATVTGGLRGYLYGSGGFIANPVGL